MFVIEGRNVGDIYARGREMLETQGRASASRAGEVLVMDYPVCSVYREPRERVLFTRSRDANPFFHLMESIWMLAGRRDGRWLDRYVRSFSKDFGEPGSGEIHGAYGHRWRSTWALDQLGLIVERLRADPLDRRVVLQMWDPATDLCDLDVTQPKDLPCNLCVLPRVREGTLDMTVVCRSNDAIWGAHGSNAVHFSILQEYLATAVGAQVGRMTQISNNYHAYRAALQKTEPPDNRSTDWWGWDNPYTLGQARPMDTVTSPDHFLEDCERFCEWVDNPDSPLKVENSWFVSTAAPMHRASQAWRTHSTDSGKYAESVEASDWRLAAQSWLKRRHDRSHGQTR